ncbi:MAG: peptidoglycan-binding protein [Myxococcaceae bacterium]
MTILTRRVLPKQAKEVKAELSALKATVGSKNVLNLGDAGKAVGYLQAHLRAAGVYQGPVNGQFDQATADALIAFQTAKKLTPSGMLDKATFNALKAVNHFVPKGGFDKDPARINQRGSDIASVERKLAKLGFLKPEKADGVYDQATQDAVLRYRKADKQVADGLKKIGGTFSKELNKAVESWNHAPVRRRDVTNAKGLRRHKQLDDLVSAAVKKAGPEGLGLGAKGRAVQWVEKHLEEAGYELGAENQQFGSRTEAALKQFQEKSKLPVTGKLDSATWNKLKGSYFGAKDGTSPAQREGEKSGAVKRTEEMLKKLGYHVGKVDGLFTANTEKAVEKFQKKNKLNVSGAVGGGTEKALEKKVAALFKPGSWKPGAGQLRGGDFSSYQSSALFNSVIRKSQWGSIKASEGTSWTDPTFKSRWNLMGKLVKSGKMKMRMAYHFLHAGNGVGQAKHFLNTLGIHGKLKAGTRLALDWEADALSSPGTLRDAANYIHKVTGVWPFVYTSASQAGRAKAAVPHAYQWIAQWGSSIPKNVPFVQYSDGPGYDHDVFNGSVAALKKLAGF